MINLAEHSDMLALEQRLLSSLRAMEVLMSALSDKIAEVTTSVDAALVRVQDDVTTLQTKIAELQAQVDAGLATPEDIAALDALKVKADALDPISPTTLPEA